MASAEVTSYTAHVGQLGLLGSERLLVLRHETAEGDEVSSANSEIYFADRFASGGGFTVVDHGKFVRGHLPAADYLAWMDLLRHEAPVFLHWSGTEHGVADLDGALHLSTGPEAPGEGPVDLSPAHGE